MKNNNKSPIKNQRLAVIRLVQCVINEGASLSTCLPRIVKQLAKPQDKAQVQALSYGVLRYYIRLQALLSFLIDKPLKGRDQDIEFLLLLGLYQLSASGKPEYAVVSETVNTAAALGKVWAKRLVNGVLRRYLREQAALSQRLQQDIQAHHACPAWLLERLQQDWPQAWEQLLVANNQQAPMVLRVNTAKTSRDDYLAHLQAAEIMAEALPYSTTAIELQQACDVTALPAFDKAWVSVQDTAAQYAAQLLQPQAGDRVLDACAAPGGKTLHILEQQPALKQLIAVDIDAGRLKRVEDNLARLDYQGECDIVLQVADISQAEPWSNGKYFDRILLDVPCSASGVIRRHPDIKLLRRPEDITALVQLQAKILKHLWSLLAPGGFLLYCTCSVFKAENERQIATFLQAQEDAEQVSLSLPLGQACDYGWQILTGEADGFFYAGLQKQ